MIYKSNKKIGSNWQTRGLRLYFKYQLSQLLHKAHSFFTLSDEDTQHELIYTLHLYFLCFMFLKAIGILIIFLTNNSQKRNFNFRNKVQLPLTIRRNIKLTKFYWLTLKFEN